MQWKNVHGTLIHACKYFECVGQKPHRYLNLNYLCFLVTDVHIDGDFLLFNHALLGLCRLSVTVMFL